MFVRRVLRFVGPIPIVLAVVIAGGHPLWAQIQLDRFYPPVVAVGGEAVIKAEGKFPAWPVRIDHQRDGVTFCPTDAEGEIRVTVPADSPPGVMWIRCFDDHSASGLVPLLVESAVVATEREPNDALPEAPLVTLPAVLAGRLEKRDDVDTFRVSVRGGETLVASVVAHRPLGAPMDAVLQIVDPNGNVLAQSDDQRGLDPQIVYAAVEDGQLGVRIFAFPETPTSTIGFAGDASFVYAIRTTTGPFIDHVLPLIAADEGAPDEGSPDAGSRTEGRAYGWNLPAKFDLAFAAADEHSPRVAYLPAALGWQWQTSPPPGPTTARNAWALSESPPHQSAPVTARTLPVVFSGHITEAGQVDALRIPVRAGETYRAEVRSRAAGLSLDSVLRVVDPETQEEIARNDDVSRDQFDAAVEFKAKQDGQLELQISDLSDAAGQRHAYSVWVADAPPDFAVTVAADRLLVPAGGTADINVTIDRLRRFDRPVRVAAVGLPEGVSAEAVVSRPKGDTEKMVKLKLQAQASVAFQGPLRIMGTVLDDQDQPTDVSRIATYALTDDEQSGKLWLTVANQPEKKP